jgi:hypothetical protein
MELAGIIKVTFMVVHPPKAVKRVRFTAVQRLPVGQIGGTREGIRVGILNAVAQTLYEGRPEL